MSSGNKQYGLFVPAKGGAAKTPVFTRANVFGDDSDSEKEDGGDWVKSSFKRDVAKSNVKQSQKTQVKKALEQDPTVFQYDEIYEDLEQSKADIVAAKKGTEKKPRYIQALLQTAERRKRENERRVERQVQKEREEEGSQFADKESFVTASYRAKLEEFKKQEEEEKRMERLEGIADVTKQKDLTGFYRHIYRQTMGETLPGSKVEDKAVADVGGSESDSIEKLIEEPSVAKTESKKDRQYRKRRSSSSSSGSDASGSESKNMNCKDEKNMDADSDISSSSNSSSSDTESSGLETGSEEGEIKKKKKEATNEGVTQPKKLKLDKDSKVESGTGDAKKSETTSSKTTSESNGLEDKKQKDQAENDSKTSEDAMDLKQEIKEKTPKICIWAKRTVGQLYDDAVKRYFERKSIRTLGGA